jgi:hypothetical protein
MFRLVYIIISTIIFIIVITLMQSISCYTSESNLVSEIRSVAIIQDLQLTLHVILFQMLNALYIIIMMLLLLLLLLLMC